MYEALYSPLPDCRAYARRIGVQWPLTPDLQTLDQILFRHQCAIPFENLEAYAQGRTPSLEIPALYDKVVVQGRGGYCFELNALLCAFPVWLGSQALYLLCFFSIRGNTAATILGICIIALLGQVLTFLSLLLSMPAPALADCLLAVHRLLLTSPLENFTSSIWDWSRVSWAWLVGAGWCVGTTALGLWRFSRKEIS